VIITSWRVGVPWLYGMWILSGVRRSELPLERLDIAPLERARKQPTRTFVWRICLPYQRCCFTGKRSVRFGVTKRVMHELWTPDGTRLLCERWRRLCVACRLTRRTPIVERFFFFFCACVSFMYVKVRCVCSSARIVLVVEYGVTGSSASAARRTSI